MSSLSDTPHPLLKVGEDYRPNWHALRAYMKLEKDLERMKRGASPNDQKALSQLTLFVQRKTRQLQVQFEDEALAGRAAEAVVRYREKLDVIQKRLYESLEFVEDQLTRTDFVEPEESEEPAEEEESVAASSSVNQRFVQALLSGDHETAAALRSHILQRV